MKPKIDRIIYTFWRISIREREPCCGKILRDMSQVKTQPRVEPHSFAFFRISLLMECSANTLYKWSAHEVHCWTSQFEEEHRHTRCRTNSGRKSFKDRRQVRSQPRVEPHSRTFLGSDFVVSVSIEEVTRMTKPSSSLTNRTRQTDHWTSKSQTYMACFKCVASNVDN